LPERKIKRNDDVMSGISSNIVEYALEEEMIPI
jgi:hypothetical protein